uniref:DUF834 domain-containing protein n=1 Tax=Oryza nivara TaxID=4536 RepID=A0A0E0G650_ORYNI
MAAGNPGYRSWCSGARHERCEGGGEAHPNGWNGEETTTATRTRQHIHLNEGCAERDVHERGTATAAALLPDPCRDGEETVLRRRTEGSDSEEEEDAAAAAAVGKRDGRRLWWGRR